VPWIGRGKSESGSNSQLLRDFGGGFVVVAWHVNGSGGGSTKESGGCVLGLLRWTHTQSSTVPPVPSGAELGLMGGIRPSPRNARIETSSP